MQNIVLQTHCPRVDGTPLKITKQCPPTWGGGRTGRWGTVWALQTLEGRLTKYGISSVNNLVSVSFFSGWEVTMNTMAELENTLRCVPINCAGAGVVGWEQSTFPDTKMCGFFATINNCNPRRHENFIATKSTFHYLRRTGWD